MNRKPVVHLVYMNHNMDRTLPTVKYSGIGSTSQNHPLGRTLEFVGYVSYHDLMRAKERLISGKGSRFSPTGRDGRSTWFFAGGNNLITLPTLISDENQFSMYFYGLRLDHLLVRAEALGLPSRLNKKHVPFARRNGLLVGNSQ